MRTGNRIGVLKGVLLLAAGAAGGGAALAVASVPDGNGTFHACLDQTVSGTTSVPSQSGSNVTVIDPAAGQHCNPPGRAAANQREITWNATGPQGPQGAQGPSGAPGRSVTVVSGQTLTLPGGQVIAIGGSSGGVNIALPPVSGRPIGTGRIRGLPSFNVLSVGLANATAKRGKFHDMVVVMTVNKASARLSQACVNGKHFPTVKITSRKTRKEPFLVYTMHDATISSVQVAKASKGSSGRVYLVFRFKLVAVKTISWSS